MARLRKEANLSGASNAAQLAAKGVGKGLAGIGKGIWRGAKFLGGGTNLGGAAVLGTAAYGASHVPAIARKAKQTKDEAMAPWQGRKTRESGIGALADLKGHRATVGLLGL